MSEQEKKISTKTSLDRALRAPEMTVIADHAILRERDPDRLRENDGFGLQAKMGAAFDIIRHKNSQTPIAVAVYGDWGTGKTSAMRWLQRELRRWSEIKEANRGGHAIVDSVWFDAWKYHDREDVWRGLIAEVILHCLDVKNLRAENFGLRIRQAAKQFGRFLGRSFLHALSRIEVSVGSKGAPEAKISGEVFQDVIDEFNKTTHPEAAFLNDFESTFTQWVTDFFPQDHFDKPPRRLAIFIDDLDRCLPEVTLEVLEALKLYLNIPGLVFVIGLDRAVVDAVVRKHYEDNGLSAEKAKYYLDKMFQVEIDIPPSKREVGDFLSVQIKRLDELTSPTWSAMLNEASTAIKTAGASAANQTPSGADVDVKAIIEKRIEVLCESNPREVKRTLNSTLLRATAARLFREGADASALGFAQGAQVYLIGRFLRRGFSGLDATWLIREPTAIDFFVAFSQFRRDFPDFAQPGGPASRTQRNPLRETPDEAQRGTEAEESPAETALAKLLALRPLDKEGNSLDFDKDENLWELMAIPFDREIAEVSAVRVEQGPIAPPKGEWPVHWKEGAAVAKSPVPAPPIPSATPRLSAAEGLAMLPGAVRNAIARELKKPVENVTASDLEAVTQLDLQDLKINDVSPLAALTNLQRLGLKGTRVSDVAPLAILTYLQALNLNGTQVSDVAPLAGLTNLLSLDLEGTPVSDVAPLAALTNLQYLDLGGTQVSDVAPLAALTNLLSLDLEGTPVSDVAPLAALTNLLSLDLEGTPVSDVAPLAALTNLQELDLEGTPVSDVAPLAALTNLQELDLNGTRVSDKQKQWLRKKLPKATIS